MKILLITNNEDLFAKYDYLAVTNNIKQSIDEFNQHEFIVIDEASLKIEGQEDCLELINHYKEKVLILGNTIYKDYKSISLEDFNISNVNLYLEKETEIEGESKEILELEEINSLLDKYIDPQIDINYILTLLADYKLAFRQKFYRSIYNINDKKMKSIPFNNKMKWEYYKTILIYKINSKKNS